MDFLEEYVIKHSSCAMPRCGYAKNGIDIDCDECQKRMLMKHDAKVRADAIEECISTLKNNDCKDMWSDEITGYEFAIMDLEELKEKKDD